MRSIAIDIGNTRAKAAVFDENSLIESTLHLELAEIVSWCRQQQATHAIVASVGAGAVADAVVKELSRFLNTWELLPGFPGLVLPIKIGYETPATLGVDRIAAAVGGAARFPAQAVLIFDAGSCLTHELVSAGGTYEGGAISPGLQMRLKAMHTFTARLPLLTIDAQEQPASLPGRNTIDSLKNGAYWGMLGEIEATVVRYREIYPKLQVILCGGDAKVFENKLKEPIFVVSELVLFGLNEILRYNVLQKKPSVPTI